MFENPRRGRQARNFTTNVLKILVLKSSSKQIFSRKLPLGAPEVSFSEVVKIMLDVAEALQYLHSQKPPIVHRDLASKNVLLTKSLHAKIADLGLAKVFPHSAMYATAVPGTPVYAAPETYPKKIGRTPKRDQAIYTEKIDIFSFGALMLETIIGHLPERNLPDPVLGG